MVKRSTALTRFSKKLRSNQTPWENKLWNYLRAGRFSSLKFKRQVVIEGYIVDFCCNRKKLIIEIDGSGHVNSENDRIRDEFFIQRGYRILRFWNNEIDRNLEGVLNKIYQELNEK